MEQTADADVRNFVQNRCSEKFSKIQRKTPALESHFHSCRLSAFSVQLYQKRHSGTGAFL